MTAGQLAAEVAGTLPQTFYVSVGVSHHRYTTSPQMNVEWEIYAAYYGADATLVDYRRMTAPSVEQVYHRFHAEIVPWARALTEGQEVQP